MCLCRWSKKWRLSEMGFGREKTAYTYFAVASCSCLPYNSIMRLVIAKAAIIVTVADDFYDMEGSLHELEILTDAVMRYIYRKKKLCARLYIILSIIPPLVADGTVED